MSAGRPRQYAARTRRVVPVLLLAVVVGISPIPQLPFVGPILAVGPETTRVSLGPLDVEGNEWSEMASVSTTGTHVAFASDASNFAASDTNTFYDIYVRDRGADATSHVSISDSGGSSNSNSFFPSISGDGRYVAFESAATNLVAGDTNARYDIFVRDMQAGVTTRVSVDSSGGQANGNSTSAAITPDGRHVLFGSSATNLVAADTNGRSDVFVHDRQTGETTRVSVDSAGNQANTAGSSYPGGISDDGQVVAFESGASNLVAADSNNDYDVFVRDRAAATTTRVSVSSGGAQGNISSDSADISGDGSVVAFESSAATLVAGDTNATEDIFVHDRATAATTRVSVDSAGTQANGGSFLPSISDDGHEIAYESEGSNLVPSDTNGASDVFIHRATTATTQRVSVTTSGAEADEGSYLASISGNGTFVGFDSYAANLVSGDINTFEDVFIHELGPPSTGMTEIIYVHGISGNSDEVRFLDVLEPLENVAPGQQVRPFVFYQDASSYDAGGACDSRDAVPPSDPNGGMPFDPAWVDDTICDSQSALTLNAVLLHADIQEAFARSGRKVIVVGHSMGAAIIRGFLAYSAELGDDVAATMVDSAFFIEGAQDGSRPFQAMLELNESDNILHRVLAEALLSGLDANALRPALGDLVPQSDWYEWVNPEAAHVPDLPYFNVYGDLEITHRECGFLVWCKPEPKTLFALGDIALLNGTDDPHDLPGTGGARFLRGAMGSDSWQWRLHHQEEWNPWLDPLYLYVIGTLLGRPENHLKLPERLDEVMVADCQSGASVPLDDALFAVLNGRMNGPLYPCAG